jgi:hypothetical protein
VTTSFSKNILHHGVSETGHTANMEDETHVKQILELKTKDRRYLGIPLKG